MGKKLCIKILFALSIIITIIFLLMYIVPFKTIIYIDTLPGTNDVEIKKFGDNLNAYYINICEEHDYTTYVLRVNAPLMKILESDKLLENPNIIDIVYGWELKTVSPLYTNM